MSITFMDINPCLKIKVFECYMIDSYEISQVYLLVNQP
jgi:hypothetical protein